MIKNIIKKISYFGLIPPVLAMTKEEIAAKAAEAERAAAAAAANASNKITFDPGTNFAGIKDVSVPKIISSGISILMIAATVIFFIFLVLGGIKWITSGGDEKKVAAARSQVTNSLVGLAIVLASWAVMSLLGTLFGITIFSSFDIPKFTTG